VCLVILLPLRDDWKSAAELIRRLDKVLPGYPDTFQILVVDDGSIQRATSDTFQTSYSTVCSIRVLRLRRNLGHQRAIAIGLAYLESTTPCDAVLIMDADGEDTPEGASQLLDAFAAKKGAVAVFAERSRRSESLVFQLFYKLYKILHRTLTGVGVQVGNFSILPAKHLNTLVVVSETWNHYAAAVFRSKLPFIMIPIPRGHRIEGSSQMNFVSLVGHGLSAISVFGDVVGIRLLISSIAGSLLAGLGILAVILIRFLTDRAIPGWATYVTGMLVIIMIQLISIATSFTFFVLSSRTNFGFIPSRDYQLFVAETTDFYP
jgi:glycosyltransferase involved in cell wall biosynthesis